jgi:hypothetical protein
MGDYRGNCFCGAVEVTATGEPAAMGYCHCESCRHWSAGPVNAFTLWPPASVKITKGAENVGSFAKTPKSIRKWCKTCGGHLLTEHPAMGLTDVYAAILPKLRFDPGPQNSRTVFCSARCSSVNSKSITVVNYPR